MYIKRKVFDVMRMKSNKRTPKSFRDKLISTVTGRVRTRACSFISQRMFKIRRPTYHFPIVIYDHRDSSERVIAAVAVRVLSDRDALQEKKLIKNNLGVTTVTTSTSCTFIIRYTRTLPPQKFAEVNSRATRIRIRCIKVPSPTPPPIQPQMNSYEDEYSDVRLQRESFCYYTRVLIFWNVYLYS